MNELENRLEDIRTPMDVAVIGCIVNGPGEARESRCRADRCDTE